MIQIPGRGAGERLEEFKKSAHFRVTQKKGHFHLGSHRRFDIFDGAAVVDFFFWAPISWLNGRTSQSWQLTTSVPGQ